MSRTLNAVISYGMFFLLPFQLSFATEGLDVNDVSVLFPLDSKHRPVPHLRLDADAKSGKLVGAEVYQQLLGYAKSPVGEVSPPDDVPSIDALSDWAVMGFRYDPCAPNEAYLKKGLCMQELRLVAQPFFTLGPADSALHIIYDLGVADPDQENAILKDLVELKRKSISILKNLQTTSGRPLGIHPLIQFAVNSGNNDVPELYKSFVLKYASASNLSQFTMMGLRNGSPIDWVFLGGDVVHEKWLPSQIPNTHLTETPFVEFSRLPSAGAFSPHLVTPLPINGDLSTAVLLENRPRYIAQNPALREQMSRVVQAIDNPRITNRNTLDCVSCHTATSLRAHPEMGLSSYVSGVTASIPHRITAFVDVRTLQFNPASWNLRSFGYFTQQPSVSLRTVNESAIAAEAVNTSLGLQAPGKDCSKVERAVMECFVRPPQSFEHSDTYKTCLKSCED